MCGCSWCCPGVVYICHREDDGYSDIAVHTPHLTVESFCLSCLANSTVSLSLANSTVSLLLANSTVSLSHCLGSTVTGVYNVYIGNGAHRCVVLKTKFV